MAKHIYPGYCPDCEAPHSVALSAPLAPGSPPPQQLCSACTRDRVLAMSDPDTMTAAQLQALLNNAKRHNLEPREYLATVLGWSSAAISKLLADIEK